VRKWKATLAPEIKLHNNVYLNNMMFADDQVALQESEEQLQKSVYCLYLIKNGI
jgi:hypothetical protein